MLILEIRILIESWRTTNSHQGGGAELALTKTLMLLQGMTELLKVPAATEVCEFFLF